MKIDSTEGRSGLGPFVRIQAPPPAKSTTGPPAPAAAPHRASSADSVEIRSQGTSIPSSSAGRPGAPSEVFQFVASYSKLLGAGVRGEEMAAPRSSGVDVSA